MSARSEQHIHPGRAIAPVLLALLAAACGGDEAADEHAAAEPGATATPASELVASVGGFETPEGVRYDPAADIFFVSNIVGGPSDKDGAGFISRVGALRSRSGTGRDPSSAMKRRAAP